LELVTKPVLPLPRKQTLSLAIGAYPRALDPNDERALLSFPPVVGWQDEPSVPAVHVNPEQQGEEPAAPHCCP